MKTIMTIMIAFLVLLAACTTDRKYEATTVPEAVPGTEPSKEPVVTEFQLGESATDGRLKVTLNSVEYMDEIVQSEYNSFTPTAGNRYVVVDITVENVQADVTTNFNSDLQTEITDSDGYVYGTELAGAFLDKTFESGDILPGQKRRGKVAYESPKSATGLKLLVQYDVAGSTAIFMVE